MADRGIGPEAAAGILGAPRECMADALDELESRYGGIERYLREQGGVDPDALLTLRRTLLDSTNRRGASRPPPSSLVSGLQVGVNQVGALSSHGTDNHPHQDSARADRIAPETFIIHNQEGEGVAPVILPLNSLVIRGKEPVVVDTGFAHSRDEFLADVFSVVEPDDIRWVFISHDDVDHTGNLERARWRRHRTQPRSSTGSWPSAWAARSRFRPCASAGSVTATSSMSATASC